ncbi:hypothetical protein GO684_04555 [Wolbachia endosymbiont of Litomosoides brasiliensis]|uniref:hypothetical protein n=1 Tax=Wolbachia endosymbiont of Litomosoides brasiliensis TaxID=1812117 RepID=UPI0015889034|nr:hypothetical protein [Wolbachia endosymbiont of Litomosoides brasiliensis]NUY39871.1 hypothetical protein [Wolbachia endosymbiont of Litomosoides brasiliensis]
MKNQSNQGIQKKRGNYNQAQQFMGTSIKHMEENILSTLHEIYILYILYNKSEKLPNDATIENRARSCLAAMSY